VRLHPAILAAVVALAACAHEAPLAPSDSGTINDAPVLLANSGNQGPQDCLPDSKLIGRTAVSTADAPGTWWRLTKDRFDSLEMTDYKANLESFYGQSFATLDDAIQFLIDGVASWDANNNGYVCAYDVRGTRAWLGDNRVFLFGISDDKHYGN
jgi:hypothetical protein